MNTVLFDIKDNVARIALNRPDKLNAFNREMALAVQQKLDYCADEAAIRCIVISGTGKAFCAGQDLEEIIKPEGPGMGKILSEQYNPIIVKIQQLEKPVIAAVNGVAAGAGANIPLACDIVIAAQSASFIQAFSKIGLIPDSGGTFFLPRLIGWQKATALMMLGDKLTAEEAEKAGLVYKVAEDAVFEETINTIATKLASMPTAALAYTKKALQLSRMQTLEQQLTIEDQLQQKAAATYDFSEGVRAFLEKRSPSFMGK